MSVGDLRIETIDPTIERLTGIPLATWRTPTFWDDALHPADRAAFEDARQAARRGRGTIDVAVRIGTDGRSYLPLHLSATSSASDVAEFFDAYLVVDPAPLLADARDLRDRLAVVNDTGVVRLFELDMTAMTVATDPSLSRVLGFQPHELTTREQWLERIHPEDRERVLAHERLAHAGGTSDEVRTLSVLAFRAMHRDGSFVWAESRVRVRHDDQGRVIRIFGSILDVTEGVRLRESRDAATEISRAVLASFPGHVALLDEHGVLVAANDAWQSLNEVTGCDVPTTSAGDSYLDACRVGIERGDESAHRVLGAVERTLSGKSERERIEYTCEKTPGVSFVLLVVALQRPRPGVIVAHLDVSDRARGEIALQAARGDLMRAARLAVAGELVGGITHDLRQPLTALQLDLTVALHMLEREPPILHEAIAAINEASGERRRLTESLRVLEDLVKQREPHRVPVALGYVAGEAAQLLRSMASARHVEISLQVAAEVPRISADATLAREAVLGLVLEAVETAGRDDRRTTITIAVDQPNANHVELTVAYPGATDADSGRHWALSVARSVVEAHQGTLSTHTDPHGVTTIRTRWPTKSDRLDSPE